MKLFIFGGPGSGKSTLSKKIAHEYNLPFFELDDLFHSGEDSKEIINEDERAKIVGNLLSKEKSWVIEGLYRNEWLDEIITEADIVIFLDTNYLTRIFRMTNRTLGGMLFKNTKRTSSPSTIVAHAKLNHRFAKVHKTEFTNRLKRLNIKPVVVRSYKDVVKAIENHS